MGRERGEGGHTPSRPRRARIALHMLDQPHWEVLGFEKGGLGFEHKIHECFVANRGRFHVCTHRWP